MGGRVFEQLRHLREDTQWDDRSVLIDEAENAVLAHKESSGCFDRFHTYERCCEGSSDLHSLRPPSLSLGSSSSQQLSAIRKCWPQSDAREMYWQCCSLAHGMGGNADCFSQDTGTSFQHCCTLAVFEGIDKCAPSSGAWCRDDHYGYSADGAIDHRAYIGGGDEHQFGLESERQLSFLIESAGVQPGTRVLDIGCGCLRLARLLVPYLDAGGYFGVDKSRRLIESGWFLELDAMSRERSPRFAVSDRFELDLLSGYPPPDVSIAFSLLTHLNSTDIMLLLKKLGTLTARSKNLHRFYATVRIVRNHTANARNRGLPSPGPDAVEPSSSFSAFFYTRTELQALCAAVGWKVKFPRFSRDRYGPGGKHQMVLFQPAEQDLFQWIAKRRQR